MAESKKEKKVATPAPKPVAPAVEPAAKSAPAPTSKSSVDTSGWKEKGFASPAAFERYLAKFSTE